MSVVITLTPETASEIRSALTSVPGLTVVPAEADALIRAAGPSPLHIERVALGDVGRLQTDPTTVRFAQIEGILDDATAARLEDAGVGYLDRAGRIWLPGLARTRLARERPSRGRSLRASGLRVAQLLADHPQDRWTERRLAAQADASPSTAHQLLKRLEQSGLIERSGRTRGVVRTVPDPRALRHWLAHHARPTRVRTLSCWLPEPHADARAADRPETVLTGAAGASELDMPVLSNPPRRLLRVRVPEGAHLDDIPSMLDGVRNRAGANTLLIDDGDGLGWRQAGRSPSGILVASPSRVMLDLWLEPRAEAAVDVFLELWERRTGNDADTPQ